MRSKIIQTELSPEEHALLVDYATQHNLSIEEVTRKAILEFIKSDKVDPKDPFFGLTVRSLHPNENGSQETDTLLYGGSEPE